MRKFWEDYGWAIALVVLALVVLRAFWGRASFCGIAGEQCLREWFSATGGWVALAIGIPSWLSLQKQIKAAIAGNENSAKILLRRNLALAKKVENRSVFIEMNAIGLGVSIKNQQPGYVASPPDRRQVAFKLDLIVDLLQEGGFDKFEEEIEFPCRFTRSICEDALAISKARWSLSVPSRLTTKFGRRCYISATRPNNTRCAVEISRSSS